MHDDVTRYPLSWPAGWKRTPWAARRPAAFYAVKTVYSSNVRPDGTRASWKQKESLSIGAALERLTGELRRLGAQRVIISSNLRVRNDGLPYAQQAKQLDDPGVAVYFRLGGKPRVLACDKWRSAAENLAAVAGHIDAIRAVERYGVGTLEQAFAGYAALPPTAEDWRSVFGLHAGATLEQVEAVYRERIKTAHPDAGGDHDQMARLNVARDAARRELGA